MSINVAPHQRHKLPETLSEGWRALESARAEFSLCTHYTHRDLADEPRVQVMSAGMLGGDILDESNSAKLDEMARDWYDRDENEPRSGDEFDVDFHHNGPTVWVCVAPETIDAELLAEIIAAAEGYADYPMLDDDDNSRREMEAWDEAMDWALRDWPEDIRGDLAQATAEQWVGYAEPGYVAAEWVTRTARELGHTARRVQAVPRHGLGYKGHHPLAVVEILARDDDGEMSWHPYGTLGRFGRIDA